MIIFILLGLGYYNYNYTRNLQSNDQIFLSRPEMRINFKSYIERCIKDSAVTASEKYGFRESNVEDYLEMLETESISCAKSLFLILEPQGYTISEGKFKSEMRLHDETIELNVKYPISFKNVNYKSELSEFFITIDRTNSVRIPNGRTSIETIVVSNDHRTELILPQNVHITSKEGTPVESISVKIKDKHFDGLENKYVVGNLVYEGLPDGAQFSEFVEIAIEFDELDIPEGYTKDNLQISWYDPEFGMWFAEPTIVKNGRASAFVNHFTIFSITLTENFIVQPLNVLEYSFKPMYLMCDDVNNPSDCKCGTNADFYSSKDDKKVLLKKDPLDIANGYTLSKTIPNELGGELNYGINGDCVDQEYENNHPILDSTMKAKNVLCQDDLTITEDDVCVGLEYLVMSIDNVEKDCICVPEGVPEGNSCRCVSTVGETNKVYGLESFECNSGSIVASDDSATDVLSFELGGVIDISTLYVIPETVSAKGTIIQYQDGSEIKKLEGEEWIYPSFGIKGIECTNLRTNDELVELARNIDKGEIFEKQYMSAIEEAYLPDSCALCGTKWSFKGKGLVLKENILKV